MAASTFVRAVLLLLAGCEASATPPPSYPAQPYPAGVAPAAPGAPPAPPAPVYTADEAVRDALASPLALVGVGSWTGYFRHLSCIYRNAQVIVVDVRCNKHETYQFEAVVIAPDRGRVDFVADATQKTAALSAVQRGGYEAFAISGAGPWPAGPPEPALAASYDDITAYDELREQRTGGCGLAPGAPLGVCSHGAAYSLPAFAAANTRFYEAPPDGWYQLVRTLVAARAGSYAAVDLGKVSPKQLAAWAGAVGFQNDIDVTEAMLAFVGQPGRFAAAVATDDGGMAYVGTRRGAQVVVARTDRTGEKKWETVLAEPGIREENDASLVAGQGCFYVHASGFVDTGQKARHRLLKLDAHGKVQWKWVPPNRGALGIPQGNLGGLTPQGTVEIDGYVQLVHDGPVLGWTAEVSAEGKALRDEVGSEELGRRNSRP